MHSDSTTTCHGLFNDVHESIKTTFTRERQRRSEVQTLRIVHPQKIIRQADFELEIFLPLLDEVGGIEQRGRRVGGRGRPHASLSAATVSTIRIVPTTHLRAKEFNFELGHYWESEISSTTTHFCKKFSKEKKH